MLHTLQRHTPRKKARTVGRGGKRGKTSGRGMKGQKARAGHSIRPALRDIIKKIPKKRGHGINRAKSTYVKLDTVVVNLALLEKYCEAGSTVTPATLHEQGLIQYPLGKSPSVKILAQGTLTKKLHVEGCLVSASAQEKITTVGGTVL